MKKVINKYSRERYLSCLYNTGARKNECKVT
jgi:hypothetical protein